MKLTSKEAKDLLDKEGLNAKDDRWIKHCINVIVLEKLQKH